MRTKATTLLTRSEKMSAFKFALEYQKIDSYKRLELQTKELSTRSFSCSSSFAGSFTRFLVHSFSPSSARWTVLIVNSVIRLSVRSLECSFAWASACSFVSVSGLFSCSSVCPVLLARHGHRHVKKLNSPKILLFLLGLFCQSSVHIDVGYDCRRTLHELLLVL